MAATTMPLRDFLLERVAEEENAAQTRIAILDSLPPHERAAAETVKASLLGGDQWDMGTFAPSPARVLAECEAKRRIVEWHKPMPARGGYAPSCEGCWEDGGEDGAPLYPCRNVRWLAAVYADHPDYDEAWRAVSASTPRA